MKTRVSFDLVRFWEELRRRRVVRFVLYYIAGSWILLEVANLLLDAFDASHYMRFVVATVALAFPVALVLSWLFDITPGGIERTRPLDEPVVLPVVTAPECSIAVLPFANLSDDIENEYFSDGLSEEIRNQLAKVSSLCVAARSSSFAFKGRHEDIREIGRRLNVATILEGGVRRQADTVRINLQLINASNGYHIWSEDFERRLDDIFRLQSEIAAAVTAAVRPPTHSETAVPATPDTSSFEAYNLYLLGRHHFHKRTASALLRAVDYFEQAIGSDANYALAYAGLADAHSLLSSGYYGNTPADETLTRALPAAQRALELAPGLAESHASLGLIYEIQGDLDAADTALRRALEINPNYSMAHVWRGLVLTAQGRFREAEVCDREAYKLDPLSPIINTNVGMDVLRYGGFDEAATRFSAAIEIDPAFPVPYHGMSRLLALRGDLDQALDYVERAITRAPARSFYQARKGLLLLQLGRSDEAAEAIDAACGMSPGNPFVSDLGIALHMVRGERDKLSCVAQGETQRGYAVCQRAQAYIALDDLESALGLYEQANMDARRELNDLITDDWVWRLPHVINRAHLRVRAGDKRGAADLEDVLAEIERITAQGIVSPLAHYWAASAHAVLGRADLALRSYANAYQRGWHHQWWARHDWNVAGIIDRVTHDLSNPP